MNFKYYSYYSIHLLIKIFILLIAIKGRDEVEDECEDHDPARQKFKWFQKKKRLEKERLKFLKGSSHSLPQPSYEKFLDIKSIEKSSYFVGKIDKPVAIQPKEIKWKPIEPIKIKLENDEPLKVVSNSPLYEVDIYKDMRVESRRSSIHIDHAISNNESQTCQFESPITNYF